MEKATRRSIQRPQKSNSDQGPGRDIGGHTAKTGIPYDTGERNVNLKEEHSIKPKARIWW